MRKQLRNDLEKLLNKRSLLFEGFAIGVQIATCIIACIMLGIAATMLAFHFLGPVGCVLLFGLMWIGLHITRHILKIPKF